MLVVSQPAVPDDLAAPRLAVAAAGFAAFVAAAAGFFVLGSSSSLSWEWRPQMKTASETTRTENTTTQSPMNHEDPRAADAAAPLAPAAPGAEARILAMESSLEEHRVSR
nr:unnamed protein product [Digitaria exilis]